MANPVRSNPIPPELTDDDFDHLSLPPEDANAPDFLDSAADDLKKPEPAPPTQKSQIALPPLPDFSEEDIALLEQPVPMPVPELPPLPSPNATVTLVEKVPIAPLPANAVEIPADDLKFLSSTSYFTIVSDIKATRKSLRQSDDVIKDATLRHEQLDQQYKRVAIDMNSIQEHFIKIDNALFE